MKKKNLVYITIFAFGILSVLLGAFYMDDVHMQQEIATKVLRFHVLANSDSTEDQDLKLQVRVAVGSYMQEQLANVNSLAECEKVVAEDLTEIEKVAEATIRENGYDYTVTASLEQTTFPVKTYGNYTFPSGEYEALRVVIGEGNGHNWWCVMYPNMCFENSMYEVVDENAEISLQQTLTEEEYEAVLESGDYEIQFKYLTFFNGLCDSGNK